MWRFTRNNGITEGFHNKMETVSRQAYGFRNFNNYRMRVKVLCAFDGEPGIFWCGRGDLNSHALASTGT